ncbi:MAG: AraC family transcriptional regulator [Nodosilinea sp.]
MTLTLSESNYGELSQASLNTSHHPVVSVRNTEIRRELPAVLGSGYTRCLQLSPGIWLDLINKDFAQPWALKVAEHEHLVQFTMMLSGVVDYTDSYPTLGDGKGYLSGSGLSPGYTAQYGRSRSLRGVNIHLSPEVLQPFLADQPPAFQQSLLKTDDWKTAWFPQVTPAMQTVAQQMMQCIFQGATRRLYLQAKVFELVALQLDAILTDQGKPIPCPTLKGNTIEGIYHARDILNANLENPPLLTELAQRVGMRDRTLRRGFRELFGTTVIGYLTQQRLMQAKDLLQRGDHTVAEVANKVGYTHLGHFAAAFRKQFGVSPREWMG